MKPIRILMNNQKGCLTFFSIIMVVTTIACNFFNAVNSFSPNAAETQSTSGFQTTFPATPQEAGTVPHVDITFQANPSMAATSVFTTPTPDLMYVPPNMGPEEFIRFYYDSINKRNYVLTWSLLTPGFISLANPPSQGGYQGYVGWWNTVDHVDVTGVNIIEQDKNTAIVEVRATYHYGNGNTTQSHQRFDLILDSSRGTWLFGE